MDIPRLDFLIRKAEGERDYPKAMQLQYWLVERTKAGRYNLACYCAQVGQKDAAFYWLQEAAREEGVDATHADEDSDLDNLRNDPRWNRVREYLQAYNRYWESNGQPQTVLILPTGYRKGTPLTVVVWLHGLGSRPDDFVNAGCQEWADHLNIAFVGVSGTRSTGPRSYVWAVDPKRDAQRVEAGLQEVADRLTIRPGFLVALGFSQGAQIALEIAVRHPERYAGAICMTPGAESHLDEVTRSPLLSKRAFVLTVGEKEPPGNVQLVTEGTAWLKAAGAQVRARVYPGMSAHTFPPDFRERFPEWIRFIEKTKAGE
jgi:predicted esterase